MDVKELIIMSANKISKKFGSKKIFLLGSYAKGIPDSESDIDLCVITDLQNKRKIDIIREIRREINPFIPYSLDIVVYGENEFNERAALKSTFEYNIMNKGVKLLG